MKADFPSKCKIDCLAAAGPTSIDDIFYTAMHRPRRCRCGLSRAWSRAFL